MPSQAQVTVCGCGLGPDLVKWVPSQAIVRVISDPHSLCHDALRIFEKTRWPCCSPQYMLVSPSSNKSTCGWSGKFDL